MNEVAMKLAEAAASTTDCKKDAPNLLIAADANIASSEDSLEQLIERKRKRWHDEKSDKRKNRLEGLWMSLFGLFVLSLSFFLFGDEVNKARITIALLGLAVTGFGIHFMITGRAMPEDPKFEGE